jgi:hypothetical protein
MLKRELFEVAELGGILYIDIDGKGLMLTLIMPGLYLHRICSWPNDIEESR